MKLDDLLGENFIPEYAVKVVPCKWWELPGCYIRHFWLAILEWWAERQEK